MNRDRQGIEKRPDQKGRDFGHGKGALKKGKIMTPKIIDIITNITGFLMIILVPVKTYLTTQPFEWGTFVLCVLGAVVAYFTGKSA